MGGPWVSVGKSSSIQTSLAQMLEDPDTMLDLFLKLLAPFGAKYILID